MTPERAARDARKALAAARSGGRRGTVLWTAGAMAVVGALLVVILVAVNHRGAQKSATGAGQLNNPPATVAVGALTLPPWPAPADASAAVAAAGLPMLGSEGAVEHIHAHLDVIVDSHQVPVPAGIGIDRGRRLISPLHIHDASGVMHIESSVKRQFSLGEFFTEWQVSLSANNIGALRAADGRG